MYRLGEKRSWNDCGGEQKTNKIVAKWHIITQYTQQKGFLYTRHGFSNKMTVEMKTDPSV